MWKFPFSNMQTNFEYVEFLLMTITDNEWKHICLYWKLLASSKLLVINEYTDKAFVLYAAITTSDNVIKYSLRFTRLFVNISCANICLVYGHALCMCACASLNWERIKALGILRQHKEIKQWQGTIGTSWDSSTFYSELSARVFFNRTCSDHSFSDLKAKSDYICGSL